MSTEIDVGDQVHHGPSNEDWIVAAVDGDRLYWTGWPFGGSAELSDCTLMSKATDEERKEFLQTLADAHGDEKPLRMARERLKAGL